MSHWLDGLRGWPQPGWWLPVVRLGCLSTADLLQLPVFNRGPFVKFAGFVTPLAELPLLSSPPESQGGSSQVLSTLPSSPDQGHLVHARGRHLGIDPVASPLGSPACSAFAHGEPRESLFPALARLSGQLIFAGVPPGSKIGCSCTGRVWLWWKCMAVLEVYGCAGGLQLCQHFGCPEEKRREGRAIV